MGKNDLNAVVVKKELMHSDLMVLRLKYLEGDIPDFKPGQFGTLGLPELDPQGDKVRLVRRAYSVASSNKEKGYLEYFITRVEGGALTPRLFELNEGDHLWMAGKVTGLFTLDPVPPDKNLVFIGTGTGVSPFKCMLDSNPELGASDKNVSLIHCCRHLEDLAYHQHFLKMANEREKFSYIPTVTRSESSESGCLKGRIPALWSSNLFFDDTRKKPTPEDSHILLCGNPDMIKDMISILESEGFKVHTRKEPGNIHFEKYW